MATHTLKPVAATKRDSSRPIYYKSVDASSISVDEESRVVKFYAAIWDNIDDAGDVLRKGCCARSIDARGPESKTNRKIVFLYQHNVKQPLGKPLVLKEDNKGLYVESPIDQIPLGDDTLVQLKSGTLNQFSIGYNYVWDKCQWVEVPNPDNKGEMMYVLECKEIELFEVSVVTFGCNEETEYLGMKDSQVLSHKNQLLRDTEQVLKQLPAEMEYQIRQLITKHIALAEHNPDKPLGVGDPQESKSVDYGKLLLTVKNN